MEFLPILEKTLGQVQLTFSHNWPYLVFGTAVAAYMGTHVDSKKIETWLQNNKKASIFAATAVATLTPLCSCGTTAVLLGMMANTMPWAPMVAFMVSSPLTSPEEILYSAGLFGWPFSITYLVTAIFLGLFAGFFAMFLEARGVFKNQARFVLATPGGGTVTVSGGGTGGPDLSGTQPGVPLGKVTAGKFDWAKFGKEFYRVGKRLLFLFLTFAFVGYLLNNLIPTQYILALFGEGKAWGVPLAATLGLPLYLNSESSLPLIQAFIKNGASEGAALAFLITGAGTSVGAVVGALTIAKWRVVGYVIGTLWVGAIITGYVFNWLY